MKSMIVYTTLGCHLCDSAKEILRPLMTEYQLTLQEVEIADSDDLIARYGIRIPVVAITGNDSELGWPFTVEQAREFIMSFVLA